MSKEIRLLSTSAILGYGFPEASLQAGLARDPHVIGVDGGSVDPGPHYLGSGKPFCSPIAIRRDLRLMLRAASNTKFRWSSAPAAAPAASRIWRWWCRWCARSPAKKACTSRWPSSMPNRTRLSEARVAAGRFRRWRDQPPLTDATIDRATRIVGDDGTRTVHGGAGCRRPGGAGGTGERSGAMGGRGDARADCPRPRAGMRARCWNAAPRRQCRKAMTACSSRCATIMSNASRPIRRAAARRCRSPITACTKTQPDPSYRAGRHAGHVGLPVRGGQRPRGADQRHALDPADRYTVKLEGVELAGYRAICVCGTRDPLLIGRLDDFLASVRGEVADQGGGVRCDAGLLSTRYPRLWPRRRHGRAGAVAQCSAARTGLRHEVVARDKSGNRQRRAGDGADQHAAHRFPGRLCREGNMAFPFSPSDIEVGPVYRFNVFHVAELDDPTELFPIEYETV